MVSPFLSRLQFALLLLLLVSFLLACQLFGFEIRRRATPTPTPNLQATIAILVTSNSQMAAQLATTNARQTKPASTATNALPSAAPTFTSVPTLSPTATATAVPLPSPTQTQPAVVLWPTATATYSPTPPPWTVSQIFFSPKMPTRLYALQTGSAGQRVLTSNNYGQSWALLIGGWPVDSTCINSINLDYHNPELFFLATCQGIYHWTTVGWKLEFSKPVQSVTNLPESPRVLWAAEPFGPGEIPIVTNVNSQTWTPASRYLEHTNGIATLMFDPTDPERLFATVWPDFPGSLLRRGATNGQWTTLPTPPGNTPIDTQVVLDGVSGAVYAVVGRQLWRSPNPNSPDHNAVSWELIFDNGQPIVLLGGSWPNNQFALFANLSGLPHYSLDGGKSWASLPVPGSS
jgi:hypothetical protein